MGHAGLYAESGETDILVDPWLFGSSYWRSWWHFPPIEKISENWLTPRYIYLSHHHFDHFHYPSLRRMDRNTHVLVPRFGVDVMRSELADLGFRRVTEMSHGVPTELGDGLVVRSFQYGVDDSALIISHGATVIADFNDCKVRGTALRHLLRATGRLTFLLKNYSAAQAYPGCYRASSEQDLQMISRDSYLVDFLGTAASTNPRYAIPFASMTCFLHPETIARNEEIVRPQDLVTAFENAPKSDTDLVVMTPGDSWDDEHGFSLSGGDPFAHWPELLTKLAIEARPTIDATLVEERERVLTFDGFADFFGQFVRDLPPGMPHLFKGAVAFVGPSEDQPYWVIDLKRRRVYQTSALPTGWATVIRVSPGVLADAIEKKIVNFIHISMRLQIELNEGQVGTDFLFWGILTIWELGYFPLRKLSLGRIAAVLWARRREFFDIAWMQVAGHGPRAQRVASSFMPAGSSAPHDG